MIKLYSSKFDYKVVFCSSYLSKNRGVFNLEDKELYPIDNESKVDSAFYRAKSKILDYAKNNEFNYFSTITIDNNKFDITDTLNLKKKILKYFSNFRERVDKFFRYILVPELGKKNKRLHFHGLIYLSDKSNLKHIGKGIYRNEWLFENFGANNWQPIKQYNVQCANYLCKYITKESYVNAKEYKYNYFCSKGLKISQCLCEYNGNDTRNLYEKQVKELYQWLAKKNLIKDYQMCSVAYLNNEQYQDFLKHVYFNPHYKKGFKQLDFNDLISKGGEYCVC